MISQPITFAYRNVVFGSGAGDAWALYRVEMTPYDGLSVADKRRLLEQLAAFSHQPQTAFKVIRVHRSWSVADYYADALELLDPEHGHATEWEDFLAGHRGALDAREISGPAVYLAVALADTEPPIGHRLADVARQGLPALLSTARSALTRRDARGMTSRQLGRLLDDEDKTFRRTIDYLDCERASTREVEWLVRRSFTRGLGEPISERDFAPQALVITDEKDERRYVPLERDVLRLMDSPIQVGARHLTVHSERGESHQAHLCVGALPESAPFPGRQTELLFAPLEALGFPVDAVLNCQWVANQDAQALVRKRIVDADHAFDEESHGDHGPSPQAAHRPGTARELHEYLTDAARPPLLRSSIALVVSARDATELEERVERLRREYAPVELHRPLGNQLDLFCDHLPAGRSRVVAYDDYLTVEQVGAMVPTASNAVGSDAGPYIGHTLSGSRQPILFDVTEAPTLDKPPSIFLGGTLGSGKTITLVLLEYLAFLRGSRVVDVDPKGSGDHKLGDLPGVEGNVERIELSADRQYAGLLDPLRVAEPEGREDLAVAWLIGILPEPVPPVWRREIIAAVRAVNERASARRPPSCGEVIDFLDRGGEDAREAGRTLQVYADTGLARLGFSAPDRPVAEAGAKQVTMLGIRNLALPLPGTPKGDYTEDERISQQTLRLLAVYAMRLVGQDPSQHAVAGYDEAHVLMADSTGRRLIERGNRMGRSLNFTPILASQTVADSSELENLLGARLLFGMQSRTEAVAAARLLEADPDNSEIPDRLLGFEAGRCYMRDYRGRVGRVQIDLVDPDLLETLSTRPGHRTGDRDSVAS